MKPKAPKKRNPKPQCKEGRVKESKTVTVKVRVMCGKNNCQRN